jgi:hypothetical protein
MISLSYLAPLAKESNVINPGGLGTLRSWEEERYCGNIRKLRGPVKKGFSRKRVSQDTTERRHVTGERNVRRLLQRIFSDFASYSNIELLQGLLVLSIREIKIVDVCELN